MNLLCVDTSGTDGSLAFSQVDGTNIKNLHQVTWQKKAQHSEVATLELERLLSESKMNLKDISHLAVNVGPGSFTGLRVGINLVKTLAFSMKLPVASVNTLELLAFRLNPKGETFVAIKAIQNYFYAAGFRGLAQSLAPCSLEGNELQNASKGYTKVLIEGQTPTFFSHTEAKDLVPLLLADATSSRFSNWKSVEPLYIRGSEAEEKLKKRLLKPL